MSDVMLTNTGQWDLLIQGGDLVMASAVGRTAEVAQRVLYRLMTWYEESPYDVRVGIPYLDVIFGVNPVPGVVGYLTAVALNTDGVDSLYDSPTFELDSDRLLQISLPLQIGDDLFNLDLEIVPPK